MARQGEMQTYVLNAMQVFFVRHTPGDARPFE
jgi:hypothetical protein